MYSDYGTQQKIRKFTKAEIHQVVQMYCTQCTGTIVSAIVKVEETPDVLRHSCFFTGVSFLPMYQYPIPSEYGVINLPYYFCDKCGKLYVYAHVYD